MSHKLTASGQRTVDAELDLDSDGKIDSETVVNVGPPDSMRTYNCACGDHFDTFSEARDHILENRY